MTGPDNDDSVEGEPSDSTAAESSSVVYSPLAQPGGTSARDNVAPSADDAPAPALRRTLLNPQLAGASADESTVQAVEVSPTSVPLPGTQNQSDDFEMPTALRDASALFERVGLDAAISVGLLDRIDTKVLADVDQVAAVLASISENFTVVEVAGSIAPGYRSVYFDTELHELYNDHHNGRRIRHKIRYRTYLSTDTTFFEVKLRTDSRRTVKHRIRVPWIPTELGEPELELLERHGVPTPGARPTLDVEYNRMTLVGPQERVTIDLGLTCTAEGAWVRFERAAIIEVKQPRLSLSSPVFRAMREVGLRPGSISKYCVGVATCIPGVKTNKFKSRLRQLGSLEMEQ